MAEKKEIRGFMALMTKYYPCDAERSIDEESFRNQVRWLLKKRVHAIGVNCGADFDYTDDKRKRITEILVEENSGGVPCYMGASVWDTETSVKRAKDVQERGVDGVFMTGPPLECHSGGTPRKL